MPKNKAIDNVQQGVVSTVFESFVAALRSDASLDPALAERLNSALLEGKELTPEELRRVLFFEEPLA